MNEFMNVQVNYNAIVTALEAVTNQAYSKLAGPAKFPDWMTMRELRTVGFTSARQTGKTQWIVDFTLSKPHGEVLTLFKDKKIRDEIERRYQRNLGEETELPSLVNRMHDWYTVDERTYDEYKVKYVVVDEAQFTLARYKKEFFQWVHDKFGESTLIVLVD